MSTSPLATLSLLVSVLAVLAIIAGGVVLFAVGKGRGALSGAGFVVLGIGTGVTTVFSFLLPALSAQFHLGSSAASGIFNAVALIFSLIGWGLVVGALLKFRNEKPQAQAPPPYGPGYGPGWGGPASGTQGPPPPPGV